MLGHAPLGVLALGQQPSTQGVAVGAALLLSVTLEPGVASGGIAADALAPGALLPLTLTLEAGTAAGEGQQPPIVIAGRPYRLRGQDAVAPGALLALRLSLLPGLAQGAVTARGAVLPLLRVGLAAGTAAGEAIHYDNEFLLLLDAA